MDIQSDEFDAAVKEAVAQATQELLASGVPLFYYDRSAGMDVMERPDGRRFQIRYIAGAPAGANYEIVREIGADAA